MSLKTLTAACCLAITAMPAVADEVWDTPYGEVVYLADEFGSAVLSFTNIDGTAAELVIPGLAGNFDDRGVHEAYWVGSGALECEAALARPGGFASLDWGRAVISFDDPAFPTSFTLTLGDCFYPLAYSIRAEAR